MDIQLEQQAQSTDGLVLSKAFVRTEDGVSYVYKDDNGVLKKQIVKVKENVNGVICDLGSKIIRRNIWIAVSIVIIGAGCAGE